MIDIEQIRTVAERDAYARLEASERVAQRVFVPQDGVAHRRRLMSTALLLTESMAPDAYGLARLAMQRLGVDDTIELFQSRGARGTARLVLYGAPIGIEFLGDYIWELDSGGQLAVIGHEIGHAIAHSGHPTFAWAMACSQSSGVGNPARRAYALAAELTADRFGLLACHDIEAVLRLEMKGVVGRASGIKMDTDGYLEHCKRVAEEVLASGGMAVGSTHPEHYVRGYAEWLFSETDLYASPTGVGTATRSIEEVDLIIHRLVNGPNAKPRVIKPKPTEKVGAATITLPSEDASATTRAAAPFAPNFSTDIAEGAARTMAATSKVLSSLTRAVTPSLQRLAHAARDRLVDLADGGSDDQQRASVPAQTYDPLEEDRRALEARYQELERIDREKK